MLLRRSKIFIVNVTRIAVSSVGAAYQANTYTQIYIHIVFAVQGRQNLLRHEYNDELQKYMAGIISGQGQKLIAINNMPDHFPGRGARLDAAPTELPQFGYPSL